MNASYGRDLDLNLLRVFAVVADTGSVTQAAAQLYLTQPAISAALRRLTLTVGTPLFARQGRGLSLTSRGERLFVELRPHLQALVDAALSPSRFDAKTSERSLRIGFSDATEQWLLPELLRVLDREAPRMRIIALPVQFRTVGDALMMRRVEAAITVADELPQTIKRQPLFTGGFVCLFDPRHAHFFTNGGSTGNTSAKKMKKKQTTKAPNLTERAYFEAEHVIVSYNGDLRGLVEDMMRKKRRVRCSVSSFNNVGSIVEGTALLATLPALVADQIRITRPRLQTASLPFDLSGTATDLLWPAALEDDDACRFVRSKLCQIVREQTKQHNITSTQVVKSLV